MLRNTPNNESIIVEYGFADSTGDDVNQIKNNWQNLAEAVVRALANYIGVSYSPPLGSSSNYYIVKKGDTLYSIAREYGVTVNEIKSLNNLTSNNLTIGMSLLIPDNNDQIEGEEYYIVKSGDTLYKIAALYDMTVNELKALNNLTSNTLKVGQKLKVISTPTTGINTYIVKKGDSLYSIAKQFGITVDELKQANNKTSNLLTIGEELNIPDNNFNEGRIHIVQKGDTLYSIARLYNTTVNEIMRLNDLANTVLTVGMQLNV